MLGLLHESFFAACCCSCSRICLLQLYMKKRKGQHKVYRVTRGSGNGLSAGEETAGLRHLVAIFPISADAEGDSSDTNHKGAHDRSVGPPVSWLGVPTTSGGPNFLGVPARSNPLAPGGVMKRTNTYGIFPPPPIVTKMQLKGLLEK